MSARRVASKLAARHVTPEELESAAANMLSKARASSATSAKRRTA